MVVFKDTLLLLRISFKIILYRWITAAQTETLKRPL